MSKYREYVTPASADTVEFIAAMYRGDKNRKRMSLRTANVLLVGAFILFITAVTLAVIVLL